MRLNARKEICVLGKEYRFYPLGDIHLGSANCDVDLAKKTVAKIAADPQARWIGMGDMAECITPNDKRWREGGIDYNIIMPGEQDRIGDIYVDAVSELLLPIADKCWAYGDGNHEQTLNRQCYTNLSIRILEKIGRPDLYTQWAAITKITFEDNNNHRSALRIFHSHGWQAGRYDGAKVNSLDYLMGYIDNCQIYLQGHSHSRLVKTKTKLDTNPSFQKLVQYNAYGAHTGSFLRTYQQDRVGYSECAGYPPTSLGMLRFNITPTMDGVKVSATQ